ncbi:UDP-N-acetylmuramoyl-L-alanine--D-glutamate ligase [Thermosipho atlanticus]|uniref:UDP-N-acetylmuramoylalanine--D-glutamate ligase n=1 Tax=Thermosipho atlanticus DSM 15807 TaxID=1123380 RepID=A0A1M5RVT7_9BACT|nr:UDP-N-acetylmuramoyl-L-alanine--D-glutamate ligase [Thermosipho atlanticus]SHH30356.1 UDP-N-acetylmuramoylalanine--D-glutamate ligase [Thermosipho atlanticus DSM 15807]
MKYALLGLGISNKEILKYLLKKGEKVFVSEQKKLSDSDRKFLIENNVDFEELGHSSKVLENDVILVSPGIHFDNQIIKKAISEGIKVDTEISFCTNEFEKLGWLPYIVAVTGSVGKSTTVSMIHHVLNKHTRSLLAGNIGIPVAKLLNDNLRADYLILEVSSFQLYWSQLFKPNLSVILNIYPNHLNWHPDMEHYVMSKFKIAIFQDENDIFVYNPDDSHIINKLDLVKARKIPFVKSFDLEKLPPHLRYKQTLENVAATKSVIEAMGFEFKIKYLDDFQKLPHRMEFVTEINGVKFFNDSKATNAIAVIKAVENFDENLHLIMAGIGKKEDYTDLVNVLEKHTKSLAVVGPIFEDLKPYLENKKVNYFEAKSISEAVLKLFSVAEKGDVIMLSPGGASFDAYKNFEERGEYFKQIVMQLKEGRN